MKKVVSILLIIFMLCSCNAEEPEVKPQLPENDKIKEWSVNVSIKNVTPKGATLVLTKYNGTTADELITGSYIRIECDDKELPIKAEDDISWTAEANIIPENEELEIEVNWEWLYGTLEPGTYRIFKSVRNNNDPGDLIKECSVEFTVE